MFCGFEDLLVAVTHGNEPLDLDQAGFQLRIVECRVVRAQMGGEPAHSGAL